jgi:hypothetical protein
MDNELDENNINKEFEKERIVIDKEKESEGKSTEDEENLDEFGDDDDDAGETIMDSYDNKDDF